MKTKLNIETWKRKSHYYYFKDFDNPFYNICSNVDVTPLKRYCDNYNSSFFLSLLFLSAIAANDIEELRYRIEVDEVIIYDKIHPFSTILIEDDTFSFCEFTLLDDFREFEEVGKLKIDFTKKNKMLLPKEERKDVIHYTTIPWISLTSISHAKKFRTEDSIPKFVFGKYFEQNGQLLIPFSIEVHHSLLDGIHVGEFFKVFDRLIKDCENILTNGVV